MTFDVGVTVSLGGLANSSVFVDQEMGTICFNGCDIKIGSLDFNVQNGRIIFENEVVIDDDGNYKAFVIGSNVDVDALGSARIVLENSVTFSILS